MERAIFAGGCFWCMIQPFDTLPGIHTIMSGYTGGHVPSPTYEQVKSKTTGHTEFIGSKPIQRMHLDNLKIVARIIGRLFTLRQMNRRESRKKVKID